jgi:hypothetical protein
MAGAVFGNGVVIAALHGKDQAKHAGAQRDATRSARRLDRAPARAFPRPDILHTVSQTRWGHGITRFDR